jgi:uncharacterized protein YegP (UPF0339 family)
MASKFELKKSSNGQYCFNLKAGNGEIILNGEMYIAKSGAENGIESVKVNAPSNSRYERKISVSGEPYFVLKAANGDVIGKSEMYSSAKAMEDGIESVKRNAPRAQIEDQTEKVKGQSG